MHCSKVEPRGRFVSQLPVYLLRHQLFFILFSKRLQVSEDVPVSLSFRGKGYALKVAYNSSVDLVLAAASEYFNSSATLKDPCMDLARLAT